MKGDIFMDRLKKVGDVKKFASGEIGPSRLGGITLTKKIPVL